MMFGYYTFNGFQFTTDQTWGIDNVSVTLNAAVPVEVTTWGKVKSSYR